MRTLILFIPGTLCTSEMFTTQIEHLKSTFPQCDIASFDFSDESSLFELRDNVIEVIDNRSFITVGFSMGGFVTYELMRTYNKKCLGAILLNSNAHADGPGKNEVREQQVTYAKDHGFDRLFKEQFLPNYLYLKNSQSEDLIVKMALEGGLSTYQAQMKVLANRPDSFDALANFNQPILLIGGQYDKLCPEAQLTKMANTCNSATLHILENCGHFSCLEKPGEVNHLLSDWLHKILN